MYLRVWEDAIKINLKEIYFEVMDWIQLNRNRTAFVNAVPYQMANFFAS